ncbi:lipoprotein insertase outer membrane protein LolB [Paraneptunicella aestuarii]|uniref:lipoprotein insertase outer membrane protein LolB n=1 Tax=Paraneptunicella aestuarii TaxID=2831148 RepID=UPI001E64423D|nr:lipoprotein insertase outer membrane protein LolB [Paraneptunicella aestuarii]UAA40184.1 lipoprotein insertase outer membrane protein LolB [Paraneptunicella aestuarii]
MNRFLCQLLQGLILNNLGISRRLNESLLSAKVKISIVVIGLILVSACSTVPTQPVESLNNTQHQQWLNSITHWQFQGRIAIKTPDEKLSAYINWSQKADSSHIVLTNLIGSTLLEMTSDNGFTTLEFDGKSYMDTDPERLLRRITGWDIPVKMLPQLVKGYIPDNEFSYQLSAQGLPSLVKQKRENGWQIHYDSFQQVDKVWLPDNLKLSHNPNNIKIRISKWILS